MIYLFFLFFFFEGGFERFYREEEANIWGKRNTTKALKMWDACRKSWQGIERSNIE